MTCMCLRLIFSLLGFYRLFSGNAIVLCVKLPLGSIHFVMNHQLFCYEHINCSNSYLFKLVTHPRYYSFLISIVSCTSILIVHPGDLFLPSLELLKIVRNRTSQMPPVCSCISSSWFLPLWHTRKQSIH